MLYGTEMPDFGDIWRSLQKESDGTISQRTADDDAERRFWKQYMRNCGDGGKDEYSIRILEEIKRILGDRYFSTITEIGPGWGNYTFDLAEMCDRLTCVDISSDVLDFVSKRGKELGLNIKTVCSKWEDYKVKQSDLVFGFNCFYRMQDIGSCLKKIDAAGSEIHMIGMTSGPEQPYYCDFEKKLGVKVKYDRLDYILLVNVLYQLGIDCNVRLIPLQRDYIFRSSKELVRSETRRILSDGYDTDAVLRILRKYYKRQEDGSYAYTHRFNAALIYW